jgi:predicted MFS family arabinose efflux permease
MSEPPDTQLSNPADSHLVIAAALAASAIGALFYNLLPLYLGNAAEAKSLSSEQIGLLGASFFLGFNVAGVSAFAWVRRWHWRTAALSMAPIGLLALYAAVGTQSYGVLLAATAIGGAAFGGLYCIAGVILGDTSRPARWYGVKTASESAAGVALMMLLTSSLVPAHGFGPTSLGMGVLVVLLTPLLFFLPAAWRKDEAVRVNVTHGKRPSRPAVICALLVVLVFYAGNSGIWAFAERMAASAGFDMASVGALLSVALVLGVVASLTVAAIGNRFGTLIPFAIAAAVVVVALLCLAAHGNFFLYGAGICLYMMGWSAGVPLALAEVAHLDFDGRYVALGVPALGIGSMLGPAIAGWLIHDGGSAIAVLVFCALGMVVSVALIFAAHRWSTLGAFWPVASAKAV